MAIVTLTTDLGTKDFYVASIKGKLLSLHSQAQVIDISHHIPAFDIQLAAFSVRNSYKDFPKGSIHIIGVNPAKTPLHKHVVVSYNDHFFIGSDNGFFSLLIDETAKAKIVEIKGDPSSKSQTFPVKDIFVEVAAFLLKDGEMGKIGPPVTQVFERNTLAPVLDADTIRGVARYIDYMGNITTNITGEMFRNVGKGRSFEITFRRLDYTIKQLSLDYESVPEGERLALFNHADHLEIAINRGNASKLFGIKIYDTIRIDFI